MMSRIPLLLAFLLLVAAGMASGMDTAGDKQVADRKESGSTPPISKATGEVGGVQTTGTNAEARESPVVRVPVVREPERKRVVETRATKDGVQCQFPFTFDGQEYNDCIPAPEEISASDSTDLYCRVDDEWLICDLEPDLKPLQLDVQQAMHRQLDGSEGKVPSLKQLSSLLLRLRRLDDKDDVHLQDSAPIDTNLVPGVDKIGAGIDMMSGKWRLPLLTWTETHRSGAGALPAAISATVDAAGVTPIATEVFSSATELSVDESKGWGLASRVGVLSDSPRANAFRPVQDRSNLFVLSKQYKLYTLKLFPFSNAKTSEARASQLSKGFIDSLLSDDPFQGFPDCEIVDCLIEEDETIVGVRGCEPNTGDDDGQAPKTALPTSCTDWVKTTISGKDKAGSTLCHSAFFVDVEEKYRSTAMKSNKICAKPPEDLTEPPKDCMQWGMSPGRICNSEDFRRLGSFVESWGTHYVTEGTFGGEMRVDVQTKKDRRFMGGAQASTEQTANSAFEALWSSSILDFLHTETDDSIDSGDSDGTDSSPQARLSRSGRRQSEAASRTRKVGPFDSPESLNGALSPMWDAFAAGSQKSTAVETSNLEHQGVERIGITFEGGEDIPALTGKLQARDVRRWSASLAKRPKILPKSMSVSPISVLFDHPDVYDHIRNKASQIAEKEGGKDVGARSKSTIKKMTKMLHRKMRTMQNYLRWWQLKAAQTGNDLDTHARLLARQRHMLRRLQAIPRKFLDVARSLSVPNPELHMHATETEDGVAAAVGSQTLPIHEVTTSTGAGSAFFLTGSDNAAQSDEMKASHILVSHAVQYQETEQQYMEACKQSCRITRDISERRTLMYGSFELSQERRIDAPLPQQEQVHKVNRIHRQTRAALAQCFATCEQGPQDIMQSSKAANEDITDPLGIQLSDTFFKSADSLCTVCTGLMSHTAQAVSDMARGIVDNRELCSNLPMMTLLDRSLSNVDTLLNDLSDDAVRQKRAAMLTCMGVGMRLEQKIMEILSTSGMFYMAQPTLLKLVQQLMRRQDRPDPEGLAQKTCSAFVHCSKTTQTPIDQQLEGAKAAVQSADAKLEQLQSTKQEQAEQLKTVKSAKMSKENQKAAEASVEEVKKKVKAGESELKKQKAELKKLEESREAFESAEKLNAEKCRFVCLRATAWGKEFEKTRKYHPQDVREDPFNEKIAARSTEPCGLTALIPRDKKKGCEAGCTSKLCLWNAGRACLRMGAGATFLETMEMESTHLRHRRKSTHRATEHAHVGHKIVAKPKKPSNGKTLICDSRWLMYDGEYIDVELPYVQGRRLARL